MKSNFRAALATMMACLVTSGPIVAGPFDGIHPLQSDRFSVGLGAFFSDADGELRLGDSAGDSGTQVDFNDVGLDGRQTLPSFQFTWRATNNVRIQAEYLSISEDNKTSTTQRIEWGNVDFDIGTNLKSDLDVDIYRASFGYSFLKDDKKELGASLGLHYADLDAVLKGNGTVNGRPVIAAEAKLDESGWLPNIGAYGNYAFSPKWLLIGRADWISANIGDYSGELWNAEAGIQYQVFKHVGIGLAYRYLKFNLERDKNNSGDWKVDLEYTGPALYMSANF